MLFWLSGMTVLQIGFSERDWENRLFPIGRCLVISSFLGYQKTDHGLQHVLPSILLCLTNYKAHTHGSVDNSYHDPCGYYTTQCVITKISELDISGGLASSLMKLYLAYIQTSALPNSEHLGATNRAYSLGCWFSIFHRDGPSVRHFPFSTALHTVCLHCFTSSYL